MWLFVDHQTPATSVVKTSLVSVPSMKTPLVDISGPDSSEESSDQTLARAREASMTAASTSSSQSKELQSPVLAKQVKLEKVEPVCSQSADDNGATKLTRQASVTGGLPSQINSESDGMKNSDRTIAKQEKPSTCALASSMAVGSLHSELNKKLQSFVNSDTTNPTTAVQAKVEESDQKSAKSDREQLRRVKSEEGGKQTSCSVGAASADELKFQINKSTEVVSDANIISSIIDKVVKSTLGLPVTTPSSTSGIGDQSRSSSNVAINTSSPATTSASKPLHYDSKSSSSNTDAIAVSWAEKKDSEPSLEVDRIQAMSACRVLLNPHSFPTMNNTVNVKSLQRDSQTDKSKDVKSDCEESNSKTVSSINSSTAGHKRPADAGYQTSVNGALDMSKKFSTAAGASQDHSDSSASSSPKRLRIVENE